MSNETIRTLTSTELHDIGARARRLSEISGVGIDAVRVLVLTEDVPRLLAHIKAQQAEVERLKMSLERICNEPDSLHDAQLIAEGAL